MKITAAIVFTALGVTDAVACMLYHAIYHPEWTQMQQLLHLWPHHAATMLLFAVAAALLLTNHNENPPAPTSEVAQNKMTPDQPRANNA